MSTRRAKQLIYGALYAVIWVFVIAVIYFLFIRPFTTTTVVQCTPSTCAPTSTAVLATSTVLNFTTGSAKDTFVAQLTNQNANYGAAYVNYEIDLYDATDNVIQSIPAQTFIYPSESKYVIVPNEDVPVAFDHAGITVTSAEWLASSTLGVSPSTSGGQFAVQNIQATVASTSVSVGGQLINTSIASYDQVLVVVLFKDSTRSNIIGASQTELDKVQGGRDAFVFGDLS